MLEKYSSKSEIRKITNGLLSGITAVFIKAEGKNLDELSDYERGGKIALDELSNPESLINKIVPKLMRGDPDIIKQAKETYPGIESLEHLSSLMSRFSYYGPSLG